MSVSRRTRIASLIGVTALAAAAPLFAAGAAQADSSFDGGTTGSGYTTTAPADDCQHADAVQFNDGTDAKPDWKPLLSSDGEGTSRAHLVGGVVELRYANTENPQVMRPNWNGSKCTVSFAVYGTEGATWQTSGTQTFLGWATDAKNPLEWPDNKTVTLTLPKITPPSTCDLQLDLYFGAIKYNGGTGTDSEGFEQGPLPHFDNAHFPTHEELITGWNGGLNKPCVTPTTTTPAPTKTPTTKPTSTTPAGATPTESATPTGGGLAHTGSSTPLYAGGALALLLVGGAGVYGSRKYATARKH